MKIEVVNDGFLVEAENPQDRLFIKQILNIDNAGDLLMTNNVTHLNGELQTFRITMNYKYPHD
ncbi:MAG: hypothetical protein Q8910_00090 [Bacteroidota bacterium]|nr:hypothetical protein [Bacteroidota bacterium]